MKKLIRLRDVQQMTGLARSTIYAYIAADNFPKQVKLGQRCVAWHVDDIESWIDSRAYC